MTADAATTRKAQEQNRMLLQDLNTMRKRRKISASSDVDEVFNAKDGSTISNILAEDFFAVTPIPDQQQYYKCNFVSDEESDVPEVEQKFDVEVAVKRQMYQLQPHILSHFIPLGRPLPAPPRLPNVNSRVISDGATLQNRTTLKLQQL